MKDPDNSKLYKVAKGAGIAVKVVLALGCIALLAFFGWLGYSVISWLGV